MAVALSDTKIATILQQLIDQERRSVGIVVGLIDAEGQRIVSHGSLSQTDRSPVRGNTLFEIGSITKVFTALSLMQIVEQGKLTLDTAIASLLPAGITAPTRNGQQIRLAHLATHTSGLPRLPDNFMPTDDSNPYADYTIAQLYEFLSHYTLPRDIGSEYEYSNVGAGLLGQLLSLQTGQDYESLIQTQIIQPLQMPDTAIQLSPDQRSRFATGHDPQLQPVSYWDFPALAAAGALRSTARDLLRLLAANLHDPIAQKTQAVQAQTTIPGIAIAYGWHRLQLPETEVFFHDGGTGGFRSFIGFVPAQQVGVVVLSNAANDIGDLALYLLTSQDDG
jgi:CubicO group peptidase (beta-lactamase class C family)